MLVSIGLSGVAQQLNLTVMQPEILLGQHIDVRLTITDFEPHELLGIDTAMSIEHGKKSFFSTSLGSTPSFSYEFHWTPTDTGAFCFGPYHIDFAGKRLLSDSITVMVRPVHSTLNFIQLEAPEKVKVGEAFKIICSSSIHNLQKLQLEKDQLEVLGTSLNNTMNFQDGKRISSYTKTFRVVFHAKGQYTIDAASFSNLGEAEIMRTRIKVK